LGEDAEPGLAPRPVLGWGGGHRHARSWRHSAWEFLLSRASVTRDLGCGGGPDDAEGAAQQRRCPVKYKPPPPWSRGPDDAEGTAQQRRCRCPVKYKPPPLKAAAAHTNTKGGKAEANATNSEGDVTHTKKQLVGRQKGTTDQEKRKTKATAAEALASADDVGVFGIPGDDTCKTNALASFSKEQDDRPLQAGQRADRGKQQHRLPELDKGLKRKGASICVWHHKQLHGALTALDRTNSAGKLKADCLTTNAHEYASSITGSASSASALAPTTMTLGIFTASAVLIRWTSTSQGSTKLGSLTNMVSRELPSGSIFR
jgi:hypothetical protein